MSLLPFVLIAGLSSLHITLQVMASTICKVAACRGTLPT